MALSDWNLEASEEAGFEKELDGALIDVTTILTPIWCAGCGLEIEKEAVIVDGKTYHYHCSGVEL